MAHNEQDICQHHCSSNLESKCKEESGFDDKYLTMKQTEDIQRKNIKIYSAKVNEWKAFIVYSINFKILFREEQIVDSRLAYMYLESCRIYMMEFFGENS